LQVFFGADVTHPPPGSLPTRASLATMTGSIDPFAARYAAVANNQTHRVEVIADAESMAKSLLAEYRKATNIIPERIIYLRDGVSEGQFADILKVELSGIREAARAISGKPVKITVIIVKKRHHTRLFPGSQQDGDRNGNVFPGTVVDTGITHPIEFDFCMSS
jgi:Piwi domain